MSGKGIMKRDERYLSWVKELKVRFRNCQMKASVSVNREMLELYWSIGRDIVGMQAENVYGSAFYKTLSADLSRELPGVKGFSQNNLRYMRHFFELFSFEVQNLPQPVGESAPATLSTNPQSSENGHSADVGQLFPQLAEELTMTPWGHIRTIIDKCKGNREKAVFYVHKTVENNWSRAVLLNFLDTDLYEREGRAISNFASTLPKPQSDLAQAITKDPYSFDFLALRKRYDERELKDALMDNITQFLMELGSGFALMGREYRLQIGRTDQRIDLLFYHVRLHCYVVIEVKVTAFESGFVGQLGTYVAAVDDMLATEGDAPTIGLLICRDKDDVLARYALSGSNQPIGISEYELSKLLPEDFKGSLPTIEEIEAELEADFYE